MKSSVDYFQLKAPSYLRDCSRGLRAWIKEQEWKVVISALGSIAGCRVLDLGCGPGWYSRKLKEYNPSFICSVDQSSLMLDEVSDSTQMKIEMDIQELSLSERFDLVLCLGVLEFVANPDQAFRKALEHLSSEGKCVLLLPLESFTGKIYQLMHKLNGLQIHLFNLKRLEVIANTSGFKLSVLEKNYGFNSVLVFEKIK